MDWSRVDYLWFIVMFLSAVWTLILMAPFTAEDPLVRKWCNAKLMLMLRWKKKKKTSTVHIGWPEGEYIFCKFIFRWTIPYSIHETQCHSSQIWAALFFFPQPQGSLYTQTVGCTIRTVLVHAVNCLLFRLPWMPFWCHPFSWTAEAA